MWVGRVLCVLIHVGRGNPDSLSQIVRLCAREGLIPEIQTCSVLFD